MLGNTSQDELDITNSQNIGVMESSIVNRSPLKPIDKKPQGLIDIDRVRNWKYYLIHNNIDHLLRLAKHQSNKMIFLKKNLKLPDKNAKDSDKKFNIRNQFRKMS